MKNNKILILIAVVLGSASCSPFRKTAYATLLGSAKFNSVLDSLTVKTGLQKMSSLTRSNGDYKEDYYIVDKNPTVHDSAGDYTVSAILAETKLLILSYEADDVLATKSEQEYTEDEQAKDLALFDYYLELTYEELQEQTTACSVVLGLYEESDLVFRGYLEKFNDLLLDKATKYNMKFISTLFLAQYTSEGVIAVAGIAKLTELIFDQYDQ